MKFYYDLHIHTALSPCADILMSPHNIINMANLIGLNIIAITDHNSVLQLKAIEPLLTSYEMLIIPGIEVSTNEGYHVICLFKSFNDAYMFGEEIQATYQKHKHDDFLYGEQIIFDHDDNIIDKHPYTLFQNSLYGIKDLYQNIKKYQGLLILAHIERYNEEIYQLLENEYQKIFDAIEVNIKTEKPQIINKLNKQIVLHNSDAHSLIDIANCQYTIELEDLSIKSFFNFFRK